MRGFSPLQISQGFVSLPVGGEESGFQVQQGPAKLVSAETQRWSQDPERPPAPQHRG